MCHNLYFGSCSHNEVKLKLLERDSLRKFAAVVRKATATSKRGLKSDATLLSPLKWF